MSFNIQDLDKVDDDNQQNWPEGTQKVNEVNNAGRADEGMLARWFADWNGEKVTAGTVPNYTLASDTTPTAYYDGFTVVARPHANNTGNDTLNVDSKGGAPILNSAGEAVQADDLVADTPHRLTYYDGNWYAMNVPPQLGSAAYLDAGTEAGDVPVLNSARTLEWEVQGGIGEVRMYCGGSAPATWADADGAQLSATQYPDLFAVLGYVFGGSGDNFNLPDLKGRAPIGIGQGDTAEGGGTGTDRILGDKSGAETVTLTIDELPSHSHQQSSGNGAHPGNYGYGSDSYGPQYQMSGGAASVHKTEAIGADTAHENMSPSIALRFIVKVGYPTT